MPFSKHDIATLRKIVDDAIADLPASNRLPLQQMIAHHRVPRERRRATHAIHNMQAALTKQYDAPDLKD